MSLDRKIRELSHGRVLTCENVTFHSGKYHDWKSMLINDLKKIMEYEDEIEMNISKGTYSFNALNHKHPDTETDFWLQKLNRDRKMSFTNVNSGTFIQAVVDALYSREGIFEVNLKHEIYSNVNKESHYLDLCVTANLKYRANYSLRDSSQLIKTDIFANWLVGVEDKK